MSIVYHGVTREQTSTGYVSVNPLEDPDYQAVAAKQAEVNEAAKQTMTWQDLRDLVSQYNLRGVKAQLKVSDTVLVVTMDGLRSRRHLTLARHKMPFRGQAVALLNSTADLTRVPDRG